MSPSDISPAVAEVLAELQLVGLKVVANPADVRQMEQSVGCAVPFPDALRQAVRAFLTDRNGSTGAGHDSVCGLLFDVPEDHGLPAKPTADQVAEVLRGYLTTDPEAEVVLLTAATVREEEYRFTPEYGESTEANWVFRVRLPRTLDLLFWAVVDKTGGKPAYAYYFN